MIKYVIAKSITGEEIKALRQTLNLPGLPAALSLQWNDGKAEKRK